MTLLRDRRGTLACASLACAVFLGFFRAPWALQLSNWNNDDGCYVGLLRTLIGQGWGEACARGYYYAPGAPIAWLPAGIGALLSSWVSGQELAPWLIPWAALWSYALWACSIGATYRILATSQPLEAGWFGRGPGRLAILALLLTWNSPAFYYAIHWPLMSHSAELLFALLTALFVREGRLGLATATALGLTLIRYNDAPALGLVAGAGYDAWRAGRLRVPPRALAAAGAAIGLGLAAVAWVLLIRGYNPDLAAGRILARMEPGRLREFLWGTRWGIAYVAPAWLAAFALGLARLRRLSWAGRAAWGWMLAAALVGSSSIEYVVDFPNRFLVGSYAAALLLALDWVEAGAQERRDRRRRWLSAVGASSGAWVAYLVTVYRTVPALSPVSEPVPGFPGMMINQGIPDFAARAIQAPLHAGVFEAAFLQQFPLVTLWLSWFPELSPERDSWRVHGPALGLLTAATLGASAFLAVRLAQRLRTRGRPVSR